MMIEGLLTVNGKSISAVMVGDIAFSGIAIVVVLLDSSARTVH